ncbi:MAG: TerC/Alx family metal homeostasis membrane protein [Lewinellaceae bacterium]|nr:TerC/Alx family metal homeostasis membrane protein [Lewinellaceae bacterium]
MVWVLFCLVVFSSLVIDLGVFNKNPKEISYKNAVKWTSVWVAIALIFSAIIYLVYSMKWLNEGEISGSPWDKVIEYLTGYLVELSLSIDNIFVIAVILKSFKIPKNYQHKVLFWGVLGAIVFRALMIFLGIQLMESISWMPYVFGAFLIYIGLKMGFQNEASDYNPKKTFLYKTLRRIMPVTNDVYKSSFFIRKRGMIIATPMFLALIIVEFTDILFAVDSIPAVLSVTRSPFVVFSSNIFAILGLRSMYFLVVNLLESFKYVHFSLMFILVYVGLKMILTDTVNIPVGISLMVILGSIIVGILLSLSRK